VAVVEAAHQAVSTPYVIRASVAVSISHPALVVMAVAAGVFSTNFAARAIVTLGTVIVGLAQFFAAVGVFGDTGVETDVVVLGAVVEPALQPLAATLLVVHVALCVSHPAFVVVAVVRTRTHTRVLAGAVAAVRAVPVRKASFAAVRRGGEPGRGYERVELGAVVEAADESGRAPHRVSVRITVSIAHAALVIVTLLSLVFGAHSARRAVVTLVTVVVGFTCQITAAVVRSKAGEGVELVELSTVAVTALEPLGTPMPVVDSAMTVS